MQNWITESVPEEGKDKPQGKGGVEQRGGEWKHKPSSKSHINGQRSIWPVGGWGGHYIGHHAW